MPLSKIRLCIPPPRVPPPTGSTPARPFHAYDELAAALQIRAGVPVEIVERPPEAPSPGEAILLHCPFEPEAMLEALNPAWRNRVFLLNAPRGEAWHLVEHYQLAGAIENDRYFLGRTGHPGEVRIYGLKRLLDSMPRPTSLLHLHAETEHYRLASCGPDPDFPSLLISYLQALLKNP